MKVLQRGLGAQPDTVWAWATAIPKAPVRLSHHRHGRALVSAVLAQSARYRRAEAERGLSVDHTTVWRWVQAYAPEIRKRLQGHVNIQTDDVVHGRNLCPGGRPLDVSVPGRR
jgi:hypothetical protein